MNHTEYKRMGEFFDEENKAKRFLINTPEQKRLFGLACAVAQDLVRRGYKHLLKGVANILRNGTVYVYHKGVLEEKLPQAVFEAKNKKHRYTNSIYVLYNKNGKDLLPMKIAKAYIESFDKKEMKSLFPYFVTEKLREYDREEKKKEKRKKERKALRQELRLKLALENTKEFIGEALGVAHLINKSIDGKDIVITCYYQIEGSLQKAADKLEITKGQVRHAIERVKKGFKEVGREAHFDDCFNWENFIKNILELYAEGLVYDKLPPSKEIAKIKSILKEIELSRDPRNPYEKYGKRSKN